MNTQPSNHHRLELQHGSLLWEQHEGRWRLSVHDPQGNPLAFEGEHTGYWTFWNGSFYRLEIPAAVHPQMEGDAIVWDWQQPVENTTAHVRASFACTEDRQAVRFTFAFSFDRATARPHFSWGLDVAVEGRLNNYRWVPGPTATAPSKGLKCRRSEIVAWAGT